MCSRQGIHAPEPVRARTRCQNRTLPASVKTAKYRTDRCVHQAVRGSLFKTFIKDNRSRWPNICTVFEGYFKSGSMIDVMKAYYNPLMTFTPNEKQLCLMELWGFDKDEMMSKASFILDGLRQECRKNSCLAG